MQTCIIRKDLAEQYPNGFLSETVVIVPNVQYMYIWENDEMFIFVLDNGAFKYMKVNSIDFDFND